MYSKPTRLQRILGKQFTKKDAILYFLIVTLLALAAKQYFVYRPRLHNQDYYKPCGFEASANWDFSDKPPNRICVCHGKTISQKNKETNDDKLTFCLTKGYSYLDR